MKRLTRILALLTVAVIFTFQATIARGDSVSLGVGPGVNLSEESIGLFLDYQKDLIKLGPCTGFLNAGIGGWSGDYRNGVIFVGPGVKYRSPWRIYAGITVNGGAVVDTTDNLGTTLQFVTQLIVGIPITEKIDLAIKWNHISNGNDIFGWSGDRPNRGENFFVCSFVLNF